MEYTFKQGDIVLYSIVNSKNQVLRGTGIVVGIAANPSSVMDTIYMVEDPECFPNVTYQYTTVPMHESSLKKVGHIDEEYLYVSTNAQHGLTITSYKNNYRKAKERLLQEDGHGHIARVMNHNLSKILDEAVDN